MSQFNKMDLLEAACMKIDYKVVGKRIRERRKELKMSQERLAELIDVSTPHMSNIENGKTKFSLQVLLDLANAMDTTLDALMVDHIASKNVSRGLLLEEIDRMLEGCTPLQMTLIEENIKATRKMLLQYEKKIKKEYDL